MNPRAASLSMNRLMPALACCVVSASLLGAEAPVNVAAAKTDADLPAPFDEQIVSPLIKNSPFIRSVSLSDSLVLTGLANLAGKQVATILNTETGMSYSVSEDPSPNGWKLIEASTTTDINRASAKVSINGEVVTIRYNKDEMSSDKLKKHKMKTTGTGPAPSEGDRFRRSDKQGPSEEDRRRYESMSDTGKEKLRSFFRENMDRLRTMGTDEERRNFVKSAFDKIEKDDKGGK